MAEIEKIIEELRAQMADFQAKISDLEGLKTSSAQERKATGDLIGTLKAELDAIRGDLATREAAAVAARAAKPETESGILSYFFGGDK